MCHMSPVTPDTATTKDPPPAKSLTLHSRLVCEYPKPIIFRNSKNHQIALKSKIFLFANNRYSLFNQKSPVPW